MGLWLFLRLKAVSKLLIYIQHSIEIMKHYSKSISDTAVQMQFSKNLLNFFKLLYFSRICSKAHWLVSKYFDLYLLSYNFFEFWDSYFPLINMFKWLIRSKAPQAADLNDQDILSPKTSDSYFKAYTIARVICKFYRCKEQKYKIMKEYIMAIEISILGSKWDTMRFREWSSHLLNRKKM